MLIHLHQWPFPDCQLILEQWLSILVNAIDISNSDCSHYVNQLVNPKELTPWKGYHEYLNNEVCHECYGNNIL